MRKNLGAKAYTYPQPVFILAAYGKDGTPNAMNAAWGGISDDKELTMCISASHKTTEDILAKKAFTVSMADAAHVEACDYVGIVSGTKEPDQIRKSRISRSKIRVHRCTTDRRTPDCRRMQTEKLRPGKLPDGGRNRKHQCG